MAEEVKKTSPGDSVEGIETVEGDPNQKEAQDAQGIEGKGTRSAEVKSDGVGVLSGDENGVGSDGDVDSVDSSKMEEMRGEVQVKAVPSGKLQKGGNVEEKGEAGDKTEGGEAKESELSEAKGKELPAEGEVPAKEEAQVEESVSEARSEDKEEHVVDAGKDAMEEKGEEKAEVEGVTKGKATDQEGETGRQEGSAEGRREERKSGEKETVVESRETEAEGGVKEKEDEVKGAEEEREERVAQGGESIVAEEEGEEAGLVSSEELAEEADEGVIDEEWITWKKEFLNKFPRRINKKWTIPGAAVFMLIVGLVGFLIVPNLPFTNSGEVKSLEEIAGPVSDMKFFLPLAVGSGRTRFVKVTVAIELVNNGFKKEIDKKVSELRKEVIDLFLTKSPKEIRSARGKETLRKEITTRLTMYLSRDCIKNIYFTELVVL